MHARREARISEEPFGERIHDRRLRLEPLLLVGPGAIEHVVADAIVSIVRHVEGIIGAEAIRVNGPG